MDAVPFAHFLEAFPANHSAEIDDLACAIVRTNMEGVTRGVFLDESQGLNIPAISLHCPAERCGGKRTYRYITGHRNVTQEAEQYTFLHYKCGNCHETDKIFSLRISVSRKKGLGNFLCGIAEKLGERPPFGPHTPARLLRMIQDDKELFLKGRRCESHGLGIGAVTYYRRVVENQKDRIIEELIKAAEKVPGSESSVLALRTAKKEKQFSSAVESITADLPQVLLIEGRNPLTLLHKALSIGVHQNTDEECLQRATAIREILLVLCERTAMAIKEHRKLKESISALMNDFEK